MSAYELKDFTHEGKGSVECAANYHLECAMDGGVYFKDLEALKERVSENPIQVDCTEVANMDTHELMSMIDCSEELFEALMAGDIKQGGLLNRISVICSVEIHNVAKDFLYEAIDKLSAQIESTGLVSKSSSISITEGSSHILDYLPPSKCVGDIEYYKCEAEGVDAGLLRVEIDTVSFCVKFDFNNVSNEAA